MISCISPVIVTSALFKWITKTAAISSMIVGLLIYIVLLMKLGFPHVYQAIGVAGTIGFVVSIVVSKFTAPLPKEHIEKCFKV
jgi:Na+/proline symporter